MQTETTSSPNVTTFERAYPGTKDQVGKVRQDLAPLVSGFPIADNLILFASELSTNAVVHTRSKFPGGMFTMRAEVRPGVYALLEVEDQGGAWIEKGPDDEHGRGLFLVEALAGEGNWGIEAGKTPDTRVVWVWLDWAGES